MFCRLINDRSESSEVQYSDIMYETGSKYYTTCIVLNNCFFDKGKVLLAKHKSSGSLVAIKHFNLEDVCQEQYDTIIGEILYMRQFKHPNIISCLTSYVIDFDLYIISPLMNFASCHELITAHFQEGLPEMVISFFLRDVSRALDYIHGKGYVHRAVKARHILINDDGHACLSGLRYMCSLPKDGHGRVHHFPLYASHNLNWLSPELLEQSSDGYDERSDIYSVGMTACELANGFVPFAGASTTLMLTDKVRGVTPQLIDCTTCYLSEDQQSSREGDDVTENSPNSLSRKFSDSFHLFVEQCSHRDVRLRPFAKQLLNHTFFKQIRRVNVNIQELLRPAVPYTENNTRPTELNEDLANVDNLNHKFTDISIHSKEWDF